jgi:hypothetical protein
MQDRLVNRIFAEYSLVLPKPEAPQPTPEVHDIALNGLPLMIVQRGQSVQRSRGAPSPNRFINVVSAQAARFRFSPDSGRIAASHRSATKSADARRSAADGGELR